MKSASERERFSSSTLSDSADRSPDRELLHLEACLLVCQRTAANPHRLLCGLDRPLRLGVVEGKFVKGQGELEMFGFARLQRDPLETLQFAHWLLHAGTKIAHVELR